MTKSRKCVVIIGMIAGLVSPAFGQSVEVHQYQFKKDKRSETLDYEFRDYGKGEASVSEFFDKPKKKKPFKTWEITGGIGVYEGRIKEEVRNIQLANGNTVRALVQAKYNQRVFKLGVRRFLNRYFDLYGNILLPDGKADLEAVPSSENISQVYPIDGSRDNTFTALLEAGGGITPLRWKIWRLPALELGGDLAFILGEPDHLGGSAAKVLYGLRTGLAFSDEMNLTLKFQEELANEGINRVSTAMFGYRR